MSDINKIGFGIMMGAAISMLMLVIVQSNDVLLPIVPLIIGLILYENKNEDDTN